MRRLVLLALGLRQVRYLQRLETRGGVAPVGACRAGTAAAVPYTATYNLWAPAGA